MWPRIADDLARLGPATIAASFEFPLGHTRVAFTWRRLSKLHTLVRACGASYVELRFAEFRTIIVEAVLMRRSNNEGPSRLMEACLRVHCDVLQQASKMLRAKLEVLCIFMEGLLDQ